MKTKKTITRKDFIKKSGTLAAAALIAPGMVSSVSCKPQDKKSGSELSDVAVYQHSICLIFQSASMLKW
jgi:hypothetical protein